MQNSVKTTEDIMLVVLLIMLVTTAVVLLIIVIGLYFEINRKLAIKEGKTPLSVEEYFKNWYKGLTNAVPIENESSIVMSHNYDGIRELDNHLPPWWTAMFVICIIFSAFYLGIYHVWGMSPLQEDEYNEEIAIAQKQVEEYQAKNAAKIDENSAKMLLTDAKEIEKGKGIYTSNCVACHGAAGEGGVGPNLTDEYWLHGDGSIKEVFKVVKNGVPEKGMIAWKATLKPDQIQAVSNFILSMKGTNPPNAKAPQGEKTAKSDSTVAVL
jgi:cytochrome c oxidase cbb3-type subunit III